MEAPKCPLCKRELGTKKTSKHHLIPKSRDGKHTDTVILHNICHQKIHSLFSEKELMRDYNTIEKLLTNEGVQKFVKWVSKKPPEFYDGNRSAKRKKDLKWKKR